MELRPFRAEDMEETVGLALRAWEPVHESVSRVLGDEITPHVFPDLRASQEHDVRTACTEQLATVATEGGVLVGFVTVVVHGRERLGEISMIAVDPGAQRRGVGRALTEHALRQIREAGCALAVVRTGGDAGHDPARRLYESTGFRAFPLAHYYRLV